MLSIRNFLVLSALFLFPFITQAQLINSDRTFDASFGTTQGQIAENEILEFRFELAQNESVVIAMTISSGLKVSCQDNIVLSAVDTRSTEGFDGKRFSTPSAIEAERFGGSMRAVESGTHRVYIQRGEASQDDCKASQFPFTLEISKFDGINTPSKRTDASTGIYQDQLAFDDTHEFAFRLGKNKTLKAVLNVSNSTSQSCVGHRATIDLIDQKGVSINSRTSFGISSIAEPKSLEIEHTSPQNSSLLIRVFRSSPEGPGLECKEGTFSYQLDLLIPEGPSCSQKKIKRKCQRRAKRVCSNKANRSSCTKKVRKRCISKKGCQS